MNDHPVVPQAVVPGDTLRALVERWDRLGAESWCDGVERATFIRCAKELRDALASSEAVPQAAETLREQAPIDWNPPQMSASSPDDHGPVDLNPSVPNGGDSGQHSKESIMSNVLQDASVVWYGPHACEECGAEIVRAAKESGGESFDVPEHLMRVYRRGAESGNTAIVYPGVWKPHVHKTLPDPPVSSLGGY